MNSKLVAMAAGAAVLWTAALCRGQAPASTPASIPSAASAQALRLDSLGDPLPRGASARLGTVRLRSSSEALVVSFCPDGARFATGHADGGIRIWERSTGRLLHRLASHSQAVTGLVYAGKGVLVSGSGDGTLRWWDPNEGVQIGKVDEPAGVSAMALGPARGTILVAAGRALQVFNAASAVRLDEMRMDRAVGDSLAVIAGDDRVILGWPDGNVHLVRLSTRKESGVIPLDSRMQTVVAASPEGRTIAWAEAGGRIRLADIATGAESKSLVGSLGAVRCLAFSPSGRLLASRAGDDKVRLWNVLAARELWQADSCGSPMNSLAFSPDGNVLAVARADHSVDLLDVATGKPVFDLPGHTDPLLALALSPDGRTLASGTAGVPGKSRDTMRAWDLTTLRQIWRTPPNYGVGARHIAWRPDGGALASCGNDRRVRLWDAADGREIATMPMQSDVLTSVAFAPDGNTVLFSRRDETVGISRSGDGNAEAYVTLDQVGALPLPAAPPGRGPASGPAGPGGAACADTSPDGRLIVGAFADGNIALWESATGEMISTWRPHDGAVYAARFLGDSRRFCSAGADTQILVWSLDELFGPPPATVTSEALAESWRVLAEGTAADAQRAQVVLAAGGEPAALFIREHLKTPAGAGEEKRTLRAITVLEALGAGSAKAALESLAIVPGDSPAGRQARAALLRLHAKTAP